MLQCVFSVTPLPMIRREEKKRQKEEESTVRMNVLISIISAKNLATSEHKKSTSDYHAKKGRGWYHMGRRMPTTQ